MADEDQKDRALFFRALSWAISINILLHILPLNPLVNVLHSMEFRSRRLTRVILLTAQRDQTCQQGVAQGFGAL